MEMSFRSLSNSDFNLLSASLHEPGHSMDKKNEISYILDLIKDKEPRQSINAFVIYAANKPIGYAGYYNAYNFLDKCDQHNLPRSLAAIDIYMSDDSILDEALSLFLTTHVLKEFNYALATLDTKNLTAISCFEKAGFQEFKISNGKILMIASKKVVRMSTLDLMAIEVTFRQNWLTNDSLWIFGSRADLSRKGGDIDIYIETHAKTVEQAFNMKQKFIIALISKIGEQKIDTVLNMVNLSDKLPIYEVAKTEGVKII